MANALNITTSDLSTKPEGVLVIYAQSGPELSGRGLELWQQTGLDLQAVSSSVNFAAKPGEVLDIPAPNGLAADRLLVVGNLAVDADKPNAATARKEQGGRLFARLSSTKAETVSIILDDGFSADDIAQLAAGLTLRNYKFDTYKTKKKTADETAEPETLNIALCVEDKSSVDAALVEHMAIAEGTMMARELVNLPPNVLGPKEFAEQAQSLAEHGVEVDVLEQAELEKLGMGSLLAVAQGSARPARVAIMHWNGGKKDDAPVALVGKGVVFDTGGISIKPAGGMEDMKGDMGGAAAVVGAMKTLAMRKAKANVVGVIGLVENMPDGNAYRPGDIVTSMSGQTIEVINTDAEGRLVLADTLWYTQDRFKPKAMINLATLTGAIMVGLGQDYAGLFSNDDELANSLSAAGTSSGEKLWRMPIGPAYDKLIDSRFADMKNTGGRFGGAITAAQFLQRFVNDVPWAHLDIAGTAFSSPASDISAGWASGFGAAVLDRYVAENHEA